MATIKLKFRASKRAGKNGVIYYQVTHQRIVRRITTDYHLPASQWDEVRQVVLNPEIRRNTISDMERFSRIIRHLSESKSTYSADDIVKGFTENSCDDTLFNYMPRMAIIRREMGKIKTAEGYQCALNSFTRFRQNVDIALSDITPAVMEEYQEWLKSNGIAPNTISFYMRKLRATYNKAVEEDLILDRKPFKRVFTGTEKTKKRALQIQELSRIKNADLSTMPAKEFARDMFLLSFYLRGMALVDLAFLKKSDLRNGMVTYRRRKTNQKLQVKWTKEMECIVKKYTDKDSKYLLPIIPPNCKDEWRAYTNRCHAINYHLKKLGEQLNLGIKFTFYTSRHSWSTVARDKGIAISVISEGLGHESERTTRIYLATLDSAIIDKANQRVIHAI